MAHSTQCFVASSVHSSIVVSSIVMCVSAIVVRSIDACFIVVRFGVSSIPSSNSCAAAAPCADLKALTGICSLGYIWAGGRRILCRCELEESQGEDEDDGGWLMHFCEIFEV